MGRVIKAVKYEKEMEGSEEVRKVTWLGSGLVFLPSGSGTSCQSPASESCGYDVYDKEMEGGGEVGRATWLGGWVTGLVLLPWGSGIGCHSLALESWGFDV